MKKLLVWLTLLTTGATVALLVAYLVPTALALVKANQNLVRLAKGLEAVRDNTAPLAEDLPAINAAATQLHGRLVEVDTQLSAIVQAVKGQG